EHDDSLLDLAPHGLLQVDPARAGGRGHGRRPDAVRRVSPDGRADLGLGHPDGRDLQLHARHPGVRLRADVHLPGEEPDDRRRRVRGVRVFPVRGDVYYWGWRMAARLAASPPIGFLYNLFLDRFIAGFTVGSIK